MKLSTKVVVTITGVVAVGLLSSAGMLLSVHQMRDLMEQMAARSLPSVRAAQELETSLLEQRGYVSYHILDGGNSAWLDQLAQHEPRFAFWLQRARNAAATEDEHRIIEQIAAAYERLDRTRDEVIALHSRGDRDQAREAMLRDIVGLYGEAWDLCESYIDASERHVRARIEDGRERAAQAMLLAGALVGLTSISSAALLGLFFYGILRPLRHMAENARGFSALGSDAGASPADELRAVDHYLHELMSDVTEARSSLERSRGQLMHAERLASVGKLAASVAHEIRNPLTSLRMRLYWLQQQVGDDPRYEEEFRVVAEELTRLESIIHNFLEFSRPPALKSGAHAVSLLIDKALELVAHRLVEKDIELVRAEDGGDGMVHADPEQLKQVFINLVLNATEATGEGGRLYIGSASGGPGEVVVRFADTGPGMDDDVRERIFEPFYSTKETGTGLGLCIAASIMGHHGGRLELESTGPSGTTFAVWIPAARGECHGEDPDS